MKIFSMVLLGLLLIGCEDNDIKGAETNFYIDFNDCEMTYKSPDVEKYLCSNGVKLDVYGFNLHSLRRIQRRNM